MCLKSSFQKGVGVRPLSTILLMFSILKGPYLMFIDPKLATKSGWSSIKISLPIFVIFSFVFTTCFSSLYLQPNNPLLHVSTPIYFFGNSTVSMISLDMLNMCGALSIS